MPEQIKVYNGTNQIVSILIFFVIIPSIIFGSIFNFEKNFWILFTPFIILSIVLIIVRTYKIVVYSNRLEKSYVFRKKQETFSAEKVSFKFQGEGGAKYKFGTPNIIAYSKGKLISQISFKSYIELEGFVKRTLEAEGKYNWFKPSGTGDVFDKIKYLIQKHSHGKYY